MKKELPSVSLIAVAGNKHAETIASLYKTQAQISPARTILITNISITCTGIEVINVGGLKSWADYNYFCVKELYKYFDTDFVLLIQWDGYVINGDCWDDNFFKYDYIGAKWLDVGNPYNVGNGGFSMRSRFLQQILAEDDFIFTTCPEDVSICKIYGQYLIDKYGIKFATEPDADKFSFELNEPMVRTFGFHGFHWLRYRETIVFKRSHALGDVIMIEPVMHHFYKLGYQVALESNEYFYNLFSQHYFPIIPRCNLNPNLPVIEVDLNMSYEVKPKELRLKTYYEFAQVGDGEIRNPVLSLNFDYKHAKHKLFEKYCILHIDNRKEAHRNIRGVDWGVVVKHLNALGYTVVQVGNLEHDIAEGAVELRTPTLQFLMWVVASSDLFLGIDSGIAHIASGFDIPSVIFFGSVDPKVIYPNLKNKVTINNHDGAGVCNKPFCWGDSIGEDGTKCYIDNENPPCGMFSTEQTIAGIYEMLKKAT